MIKNYLLVAFRNIAKYKFFSAINIFGMTAGVTACMLLILYVADELQYDRFHSKIDRMYRVNLNARLGGQDIATATTCPPMAAALVSEMPEVEEATRFANAFFGTDVTVKYEDLAFVEKKVFAADSNFFDFFDFELLKGDPHTALKEPHSLVMTESVAKKYFGDQPALGKMVTVGNDRELYKITGIAADVPSNSHIQFKMLASASTMQYLKDPTWLNNNLYTYFIVNSKATVETVHEKFKALAEKYVGPELEKYMGVSLKQMREQGGAFGYTSIPVADIHLRSQSHDEEEPKGHILYVYIFTCVGLFIIAIACINFMNLATARSAGRAKEVGLRKTLGSQRQQLIVQFLAESMLYSLITVVLALGLCYLLLPYFNVLAGKQLTMAAFASPYYIGGIVTLIAVVGLAAGSYPAFYLTSFNPVQVLKGQARAGMKSRGVRSALVVFQFALSIFLIIFTAVVFQQISFMQQRDPGIDKHNVLIVKNAWKLGENMLSFKNTLLNQTGVVQASFSGNSFPGVNQTTVFKSAGDEQDHIMGVYSADYDHQAVMKFELTQGRYFSRDFPADSSAILLNEAAVAEFGFKNPLQEEIIYNDNGGNERLKVVGVFRNFNFESLRDKVRPLAIRFTPRSGNLMIRYEGDAAKTVAAIEKQWKEQTANEPLQYAFLDQNFDQLFRSEQRVGVLFSGFSALAILIACLGLFALAAFTSEQRTKEIGIRKALGASMGSLVLLLSKEFTRLVLLAFFPAALAGWYISNWWLEGFAYRVAVAPSIIVLSGLAAIVIAWLTVSYQSIKTARTNPVDSLRYE